MLQAERALRVTSRMSKDLCCGVQCMMSRVLIPKGEKCMKRIECMSVYLVVV